MQLNVPEKMLLREMFLREVKELDAEMQYEVHCSHLGRLTTEINQRRELFKTITGETL